jgi:hypothetical protein
MRNYHFIMQKTERLGEVTAARSTKKGSLEKVEWECRHGGEPMHMTFGI